MPLREQLVSWVTSIPAEAPISAPWGNWTRKWVGCRLLILSLSFPRQLPPPYPPDAAGFGPVWDPGQLPPGASAGTGALAAVPATHQNHKQTLLPRNTASPQHSRAGGIMGAEPEALAGHHRLSNPCISQTGRLRLPESGRVLLKFTQVFAPISCTAELVSSLPSLVSAPSWAHELLKESCCFQL